MSDLLTSQDWQDITSAIKDVTDTFCDKDLMYIKRQAKLAKTSFDRQYESKEEITVKCMQVFKTETISKNKQGQLLETDGYVLMNYDDCQTAGLIDIDNNFTTVLEIDIVNVNGQDYKIIDQMPAGPLQDKYAIVKIYFKKELDYD